MQFDSPSARPSATPTSLSSLSPATLPIKETSLPSFGRSSSPSGLQTPSRHPSTDSSISQNPFHTADPSNSSNKPRTVKPSTASPSLKPTSLYSEEPTVYSSRLTTLAPTIPNRCVISAEGDFGHLSTNDTMLFVDYKYELTTNATIMNETGASQGMVAAIIEKSLSTFLVPLLFKSCDNYMQAHRTRRIESADLVGISASPEDILSLGNVFISFLQLVVITE